MNLHGYRHLFRIHRTIELIALLFASFFSANEDTEMTIREMVSIVTGAMNFEGDIQFDTTKSDGKLKWTMNNGKLRKYLPDFKFTPFPEGNSKS